MLYSLVALAVVPFVPHDCAPNRRIHAKGLPIPAQPIEASSNTKICRRNVEFCRRLVFCNDVRFLIRVLITNVRGARLGPECGW